MRIPRSTRRRQNGSVIIFAALGLSLAIILLSIADIGFMYYYKREYQKAADLAALAGAGNLVNVATGERNCGTAGSAQNPSGGTGARGSAWISTSQNLGEKTYTPTVDCGIWTPSAVLPASRFVVSTDANQMDAVRVVISGAPPGFLPFISNRTVSASAIASTGLPRAAFSVGTRLAALGSNSVVGNVLKGVGIDTGLDLMSYNGLAGVSITPKGLLEALGIPVSADLTVADFNALLTANKVSLGQILDAAATLAGQSSLLNLNAQLITALKAKLNVAKLDDIKLGSDAAGSGLFAAITSPAGSALDVNLDALNLVSTAIGIATSGRGVALNVADLGGLGKLAGAAVTAKVGVIEPPSIGIGGVGTKAYSAQTRVYASVVFNSADLLMGVGGLLSSALGTKININLPLVIDLAAAKGTVGSMCTPALKALDTPKCPGGKDCARIDVNSSIAKICVGDINPSTIFSTKSSCDVGLTNKQILDVKILNSSLIGLNTHLSVDALATDAVGEEPPNPGVKLAKGNADTVNGQLNLGATVKNLTDALLAGLLGAAIYQKPTLNGSQNPDDAKNLATGLWNQVGGNTCGSLDSNCRKEKRQQAKDILNNASAGLNGFLATAVLNPVVSLLDAVLTLDLGGVLQSVGGLVGGLLNAVGGILGGVVGNPCTGGLLYGFGSNSGCINQLQDAVIATSGSSPQSGVVSLLGLVMELLRPILDDIGSKLLTPLLTNLIGLQIGQTDITLMGLECRAGAVLVD